MFSLNNFKDSMLPVFTHHMDLVLEELTKFEKPGDFVDMSDLTARYTLDSIGAIAFGVEIGSIENGEKKKDRFPSSY